jgi:hypothetical protein
MMTQKSEYRTVQGDGTSLHYRLTSEEWLRACHELKPSEKDVLYYLRTLDPFGDRAIEIKVREMARQLGTSPSTVSRALKSLDAKGWIDLEIMSAKVTLHTNHAVETVLPQRNTVASGQHLPEIPVEKVLPQDNAVAPAQRSLRQDNTCCVGATLEGQNGFPVESLEANQGKIFGDSEFSTECTRSVLKQTYKQTGSEANLPVEINSEGLGTLLEQIEAVGVSVNPALQSTLISLHTTDPEEAAKRVRNALSSLREQDNVRNPQGFLNAALQRGFTANQAKQDKRFQNSKQNREQTNVPPVRDLSAVVVQIGIECERLGLNRDEAVQRLSEAYGWTPKQFADLDGDDMELLLAAMTGWS